MSYNVDTATYITGSLSITKENALKAIAIFGDRLPECGFLVDILEKAKPGEGIPEGAHEIEFPGFHGEGSGYVFEETKQALALCHGDADVLFAWEGGDSYSGLRVEGGKVTEHEVIFALGDEKN